MTLIEKLEAATGPDRQLDMAIAVAAGVHKIDRCGDAIEIATGHRVFGSLSYTSSIDAAMTLTDDDQASDILNEAMEETSRRGWMEGFYKEALILNICISSLKAREIGQ